jgi:hypothetical protein
MGDLVLFPDKEEKEPGLVWQELSFGLMAQVPEGQLIITRLPGGYFQLGFIPYLSPVPVGSADDLEYVQGMAQEWITHFFSTEEP